MTNHTAQTTSDNSENNNQATGCFVPSMSIPARPCAAGAFQRARGGCPGIAADQATTQDGSSFSSQESAQDIEDPQSTEEAYLGSFQALLQNSLGYYVIIDFLIGTSDLTSRSGILFSVGNNCVTLYEPNSNQYIVCDLFSVKFVTFFPDYYAANSCTQIRPNGYTGRSNMTGNRRMY